MKTKKVYKVVRDYSIMTYRQKPGTYYSSHARPEFALEYKIGEATTPHEGTLHLFVFESLDEAIEFKNNCGGSRILEGIAVGETKQYKFVSTRQVNAITHFWKQRKRKKKTDHNYIQRHGKIVGTECFIPTRVAYIDTYIDKEPQ